MIDLKILRENPEVISQMLKQRNLNIPLDRLLSLDTERRSILTRNQKLKTRKNKASQKIANSRKNGDDISPVLEEMRRVSQEIFEGNEKARRVEEELYSEFRNVPNLVHPSVPIGVDSSSNVELFRSVTSDVISGRKDHISLAENLNLIDLKRAAKVAGSRFYYLRSELVRLNYALILVALDFISTKGYTPIQPPYLLNKEATSGAVILSDFEDMIYKIEGEDLYLIATSEHPLVAMHLNEIFGRAELPKRYAGVSPCFRKEAGAHGRDTKGIFRVHQFEKVELFVFSSPEDSWREHEQMLEHVKEFYQILEIPFRVMLLSSGDMGKVASKTYDIEAWLPGQQEFRELVSCSNCTDYQSRNLGIKFRNKPHEDSHFVHTLNSTLVATERTLVAIMENNQLDDGSIAVPKALQKYAGGLETIGQKP
ncbi:MAG: serine--tRNA ligase [Nitrososphaerales archaeon]